MEEIEKNQEFWFFSQFSEQDMAIFRSEICSKWPKMVLKVPPARYFDALVHFHRFTGPLGSKKGRNWVKSQKSQFSGNFQRWIRPFQGLKTVPINQNWFFFGPGRGIRICKDVSKCLLMQSRQSKGPKLGWSRKSHFPADIHKVKSHISSNGKRQS